MGLESTTHGSITNEHEASPFRARPGLKSLLYASGLGVGEPSRL